MRVLVACEFSGIVRDAFANLGHDAWSCDLLPSERPSNNHIKGDVLQILKDGWNLMIAHPPCTHLAVSGSAWFKKKRKEQHTALEFFCALLNAPIPKIAVENPVSIASSHICKPDQIIQPWMFGHGEVKATCFWLKNLPKLKPTTKVEGREPWTDTLAKPQSRTVEEQKPNKTRNSQCNGHSMGQPSSQLQELRFSDLQGHYPKSRAAQ